MPVAAARSLNLTALAAVLLLSLQGCSTRAARKPAAPFDPAMFGATSMRIHPIFTQVDDWSGDDRPDGIEALIEFQDRFGDPTKAAGTVVFELYDYRPYNPDPRGGRVASPFFGSLQSLGEQRARWNRTSRTYQFQLATDALRPGRNYVLTAAFDYGDGRFFDSVVLEAQRPAQPAAATAAGAASTTDPAAAETKEPAGEPGSPAATRPAE